MLTRVCWSMVDQLASPKRRARRRVYCRRSLAGRRLPGNLSLLQGGLKPCRHGGHLYRQAHPPPVLREPEAAHFGNR